MGWKTKLVANKFDHDLSLFLQAARQVLRNGLDWNKP
jgi:hypothetical protein